MAPPRRISGLPRINPRPDGPLSGADLIDCGLFVPYDQDRVLPNPRFMTHKGLLIVAAVWLGSVGAVAGQLQHPTLLRNHAAIRYDSTAARDPIAQLNERLTRGEVTLERRGPSGYLQSVLEALRVPVASQMLVI